MNKMSADGAKTVRKMSAYLGTKGINSRELKKIKADIEAMAIEAEARGESVESLFPNGVKAFCDEVSANAVKKKWYEYVLEVLFNMTALFAVLVPLSVLGIVIWPDEGEAVRGVTAVLDIEGLIVPIVGAELGGILTLVTNRYVFAKKKLAVVLTAVVAIPVAVVVLVFAFVGLFGEETALVTVNWVVMWIAGVACAAVLFIASHCATKRAAVSPQSNH